MDRSDSSSSATVIRRDPESPARPGSIWSTEEWSRFLTEGLNVPVEVRYGRSRSVPVAAKPSLVRGVPGFTVRMHRMFEAASPEVRDALVKWLRVGRRARRAGTILDDWIQAALAEAPRPTRESRPLEPAGRHHDLSALAEELFTTTFAGDFEPLDRPGLTWGRRARSRSRRSLRLGSFDLETRVVRIHPVLDQEGVPAWFVRFVLMHELLHAVLPPRLSGSRWIHHGPEFRKRERAHPDYERAVRWEEENLTRLIRAARTGKPLVPRRTKREDRAGGEHGGRLARIGRQLGLFADPEE